MTELPITLVLHRPADGTDSRWSRMHGPHSPTPLEQWLGPIWPSSYSQADPEERYAFEPLANMWSEDILDSDSDSDYGSDSDFESDNDNNDHMKVDSDDTAKKANMSTQKFAIDDNDSEEEDDQNALTTSTCTSPIRRPQRRLHDSSQQTLTKFYKAVVNSSDKFFFVYHHAPPPFYPNGDLLKSTGWNVILLKPSILASTWSDGFTNIVLTPSTAQ